MKQLGKGGRTSRPGPTIFINKFQQHKVKNAKLLQRVYVKVPKCQNLNGDSYGIIDSYGKLRLCCDNPPEQFRWW